jgi:uncharacterized damage-inducible protein DinB
MTAQYGPHRWSPGEYDAEHTDRFRGAHFIVSDLTGARFVDCDLSQVKVIDCALVDVSLSGWVDRLVVNDVDVTEFVSAELDRRFPERVQLREIQDAAGFRDLWATLEQLWSETVARAEALPEAARHERVDDEWSFVETMRHLVYCTDAWASRTILDEPNPFDRLALPQTAYPPTDAAALGMELDAQPSYAEVMAVRADRIAMVRRIVDGLSNSDLGREVTRPPAPGYPEEERNVASCLAVVMEEEIEHRRYAVRDLAALEAR